MKRYERPERSRRSRRRLTIWAATETSSAETGSSQTTRRGPVARARAIATRWRWPPESSDGKRPATSEDRPTEDKQLAHALCPFAAPRRGAGRGVARPPARRPAGAGSARPAGPGRRSERHGGGAAGSRPKGRASPRRPSRTSPRRGATRRATMRPTVVFPLPDSPTRPSVSPGRSEAHAPHRR